MEKCAVSELERVVVFFFFRVFFMLQCMMYVSTVDEVSDNHDEQDY